MGSRPIECLASSRNLSVHDPMRAGLTSAVAASHTDACGLTN